MSCEVDEKKNLLRKLEICYLSALNKKGAFINIKHKAVDLGGDV